MGRVVAAFGVQGWVRVKAFTEKAATLGEFPVWRLEGPQGTRELSLESFELHAKGPVAKLAGVDDRDAAEGLRGSEISVPRAALAEPEEGTHYWVDLVGLEVVDVEGRKLGAVESLFEAGDTSVLVVKGERERMIPFVPDYVKQVDREAGRITVDWKADYDA
jgi:16S rRNA processing protein RimM